jgi:hypothetical protein
VEGGLVVTRVAACAALLAAWICPSAVAQPAPPSASPEARAVSYLALEVPRWRREHPCYSCHNNGDATRALLAARKRGHDVGTALDDTLAWLAAPERWDANGAPGGSQDLPLARIQFASALGAFADAGRADPRALERAAELVAANQQPDGSWVLSATQTIGGATFYGRTLATAMARRVLARSTVPAARAPLARADAWLRSFTPETVLDASSALLGLSAGADDAATQRARALGLLKQGQRSDGGWGPYVTSRSEVFDTALALLSLSPLTASQVAPVFSATEFDEAARRGRQYLIEQQDPDGSWAETTRPSGGESYAQRISTTAWALLALLASS